MNDGLIPNRYAKALYKQAIEAGDAKAVYEQSLSLEQAYASEAALAKTVSNPYVVAADKSRVLLTAAGAEKGGSLDKFITLVIKNNREDFLRMIALSYAKLYRKANNIAQVEIVTATQLPEDKIEAILGVVKQQLSGKTLEISKRVDSDLIGGFVVNVDSLVLDASVRNELNKMRVKLLS
ncbi:MAG: ATP synthase F1 subunit delta [Muribaculaceae bacterium]|nr:ATP synthase F1 subunit delta [Muribaculaceae bacterium]